MAQARLRNVISPNTYWQTNLLLDKLTPPILVTNIIMFEVAVRIEVETDQERRDFRVGHHALVSISKFKERCLKNLFDSQLWISLLAF